MTITNGSGEKITSIEFGIRRRAAERPPLVFAGFLLRSEEEKGNGVGGSRRRQLRAA